VVKHPEAHHSEYPTATLGLKGERKRQLMGTSDGGCGNKSLW
jgi:hypothetical protein